MHKIIVKRQALGKFMFVSLMLHMTVFSVQGFIPVKVEPPAFPPIQVKYIPAEKKQPKSKKQTFIETPKPKKIEKPKSKELLAAFDSRAHSNKSKKKARKYRNKKTIVPKVTGVASLPTKSKEQPKEKKPVEKPKPVPRDANKIYPLRDKGILTPAPLLTEPNEKPIKEKARPGSALAMLDGFDAEKYAAMDTGSDLDDADDDEPISLDTTETKYASYFARIKHQIERVWIYPEEAARRGISGEITLKFQILRDGTLGGVRLVDPSGSDALDYAAVNAIKGAAPYYPFPVTIDRQKISILATFIYSPSYGSYYK